MCPSLLCTQRSGAAASTLPTVALRGAGWERRPGAAPAASWPSSPARWPHTSRLVPPRSLPLCADVTPGPLRFSRPTPSARAASAGSWGCEVGALRGGLGGAAGTGVGEGAGRTRARDRDCEAGAPRGAQGARGARRASVGGSAGTPGPARSVRRDARAAAGAPLRGADGDSGRPCGVGAGAAPCSAPRLGPLGLRPRSGQAGPTGEPRAAKRLGDPSGRRRLPRAGRHGRRWLSWRREGPGRAQEGVSWPGRPYRGDP